MKFKVGDKVYVPFWNAEGEIMDTMCSEPDGMYEHDFYSIVNTETNEFSLFCEFEVNSLESME